ncbi:MAG: SLBB domain-containing protein [Chlamydiae bacterium]|nr:SLBB domain-containing protein [Chlamydiota bacterium]MBI3267309.1 SLBB domain-containing protein [Chlamydiota bacterium]
MRTVISRFILFLVCIFAIHPLVYALEDYTIGVDDVLEIVVYDEPDLSVQTRVSSDGSIHYPLLGKVEAQGLSTSRLQAELAERLAKDYLVNPQVNVVIKEYTSIYVVGEVRNPGPYKLAAHTTVMEAISTAGGLTDIGDASNIVVIRKEGSSKKTFSINLSQAIENADDLGQMDMSLQPNDVVKVKKLQNINILGEVKSPGQYPLKENLTVIEAITLAGGFTKIASPNRTRVIRTENGKKKSISVSVNKILKSGDKKKDIVLKPNDIIIVPESFL